MEEGRDAGKALPGSKAHMYHDLVWLWPYLSPVEDYELESRQFIHAILEHLESDSRSLLDIGCGGGCNDHHLKDVFEVTGVDVSDDMLDHARTLNPGIRYIQGDMRTVRLGRTYDVVTILDSIGYMLTEEDLRAAFTTAFEHLKLGGVFLTYVETPKDNFSQGRTKYTTTVTGDTFLTLIWNDFDPDPEDTSFECTIIYLLRRGGNLEVHTERQLLGLFPMETWSRLLEEVGFEVTLSEFRAKMGEDIESIPLFIGKRSTSF